jgi:hypothetical protein
VDKKLERRVGTRKTRKPAMSPLRKPVTVGSAMMKAMAMPRTSAAMIETTIILVDGKATRRIAL